MTWKIIEGELSADSTVAFFATVQTEGSRNAERKSPTVSLFVCSRKGIIV